MAARNSSDLDDEEYQLVLNAVHDVGSQSVKKRGASDHGNPAFKKPRSSLKFKDLDVKTERGCSGKAQTDAYNITYPRFALKNELNRTKMELAHVYEKLEIYKRTTEIYEKYCHYLDLEL